MPAQPEQLIVTFAALLKGHDEIVNRCRRVTAEGTQHGPSELETLLTGFHEARSAWEKKQVTLADDFNLLQVMGVADDEVTHSKILASLSDARWQPP